MTKLTIDIPVDLRSVIERHSEIDWVEIAGRTLLEYARKVALADRLAESSALSQDDVQALDKQIKASIAGKAS